MKSLDAVSAPPLELLIWIIVQLIHYEVSKRHPVAFYKPSYYAPWAAVV